MDIVEACGEYGVRTIVVYRNMLNRNKIDSYVLETSTTEELQRALEAVEVGPHAYTLMTALELHKL